MPDALFDFGTDFSAQYDHFVRSFVPGYDSLFNIILALLQTEIGPKANLLVVGAGTGRELLTFGSRMPRWSFTAVDPSAQMVEQCRTRLADAGMTSRVDLRQAEVHDLPSGESYDAATCILVLHFVPDNGSQYALLRGISQRLKRGGSLVLVHHYGDTQSQTFHHLLSAWMNYHILNGMSVERANRVFDEAAKTHYFISEQRTLDLLNSTGFDEVERFYTALVTGGWLARKR